MNIVHDRKRGKLRLMNNNKEIGYLQYAHPKDASGTRNIIFEYVYIDPAFRRRGLATKLLVYAINKFKNMTWISLWTGRQAETDKSYYFYEKAGFKEVAYQADYYEDGIGTRLYVRRMK